MGNIITNTSDNDRAYDIDATGNLSLLNTLNAKTGIFDNTSWFKQNVIVDGTIDGVDIAALKTSVDGMSSAGEGTFTGKTVSALNFTGTSGNFNSLSVATTGTFGAIKTSLLDINGNITSSVGPKYITASTSSGLKLENGSTTSNGYVQVNSDGSISIIPYTGKSLVLGGNMTGSGSINAGAGTFSSLTTSGALSAGAGTLTSLNLTSGLTGTSGTFSNLLTANGGLSVPSTSTLTLGGSMTGAGAINAGTGTFSSLITTGALSAGAGTLTSLNLTSGLTGTSGTFSNLLTANGGLTVPSTSTLTLGGSMTGAGNINAGAGTFSSLTTTGAVSADTGTFSGLLTASNGLKIGPSTSTNNWQIKENSNGDLCFFRSGNAFACINNSGNLYAPITTGATTTAATTSATTTSATTTSATTTSAAAPAPTKVVTTDFTTFPLKGTSSWTVNDKVVLKDGSTNNVLRGIVTNITGSVFLPLTKNATITFISGSNNTTTQTKTISDWGFNVPLLLVDNSNGNPATSLLRWA